MTTINNKEDLLTQVIECYRYNIEQSFDYLAPSIQGALIDLFERSIRDFDVDLIDMIGRE